MRDNINGRADLSFELYQKYFSLANKQINITLKGNAIFTGRFIGFFRGEDDSTEPYIIKWHFANMNSYLGIDGFGYLEGQVIYQKDILQITFTEDGSSMLFKN